MAVTVNTTRKAVEIAWNTIVEAPPDENPPGGFPDFPHIDNSLPEVEAPVDPGYGIEESPPHVDHTLPGDQPEVDHDLPGDQPHPDHTLPGDQPSVEHPIYLPPYIDNSLPGAVKEALKEFLTGNLPPAAVPQGGKVLAVQVFAQGQDGDWSNTPVMPNDGLAVLTYPEDFTGESYVEVREATTGALVDSGTITVG